MNRFVIFDLYDTLVRVDRMDFSEGLELVRQRYLPGRCTPEQMKEFSGISLQKLLSLHKEEKEYPFLTGEMRDLLSYFGYAGPLPDEAFEFEFMNRAGHYSLCEGVKETLNELRARGAELYVLSNSIYSSASARKLLESLGILRYFERVFSSADTGVCKPSEAFFAAAEREILQKHPEADLTEAFFCGDRYDLDAKGGVRAGLRTVWLNKKGEENKDDLPVSEIRAFPEILGLVYPDKTADTAL